MIKRENANLYRLALDEEVQTLLQIALLVMEIELLLYIYRYYIHARIVCVKTCPWLIYSQLGNVCATQICQQKKSHPY